jgi:large repetitive protein
VTTTPRIWKSQTQVNTSDAPVAPGGTNGQFDPQIVQLQDGGYVVVWTDTSRTYNANGTAVVGQRYNSAGNKVGGEVYLSPSISDEQFSPAVTVLPNGNIAVAFVDRSPGVSALDDNIVVRIFDSALNYIKTDVIDAVANQTVEPSITVFGNGNYVVSYT